MCEAKPGPRCATDTRRAAVVMLDAYRRAYPDGPDVIPLSRPWAVTALDRLDRAERDVAAAQVAGRGQDGKHLAAWRELAHAEQNLARSSATADPLSARRATKALDAARERYGDAHRTYQAALRALERAQGARSIAVRELAAGDTEALPARTPPYLRSAAEAEDLMRADERARTMLAMLDRDRARAGEEVTAALAEIANARSNLALAASRSERSRAACEANPGDEVALARASRDLDALVDAQLDEQIATTMLAASRNTAHLNALARDGLVDTWRRKATWEVPPETRARVEADRAAVASHHDLDRLDGAVGSTYDLRRRGHVPTQAR